jgi:3'(2'), 5'-bisphosphate nucleotidase
LHAAFFITPYSIHSLLLITPLLFCSNLFFSFAAPESILKAAGGAITNLDNQELIYGKTSFEQGGIIVATNNKNTHGSICREIKKIIEKEDIYPI